MVTQRRYSVTGQTPPDDAEAMKARSPKLQPLDTTTTAQTSCGLCEGGAEASVMGTASDDSGAGQLRGRKMGQAGIALPVSSKRSATQLPSPSSPSNEVPPKMARYRLGHDADVDMDVDTDTDTDSDVTDVFREGTDSDENSYPSSILSMPDAPALEQLQLCAKEGADDDCMEDLALSPSHSRNHSLDRIQSDEKFELQQSWAAFQRAALSLPEPEVIRLEQVDTPLPDDVDTPLTFLTLPPEIRHHIYRNCENMVLSKPLVYCISTFNGEMQHPLASVSSLVRSEALAIFYSYNTWVIKVEFRIMYDAFRDWIIRLGAGAGLLRLVNFSVRGSMFKPKRTHVQSVILHGQGVLIPPGGVNPSASPDSYSPPDGDASFHIDLSEKFIGGCVQLVRNDGTQEAGQKALLFLEKRVAGLWEKRRQGTLNGQDWMTMTDDCITFFGGW